MQPFFDRRIGNGEPNRENFGVARGVAQHGFVLMPQGARDIRVADGGMRQQMLRRLDANMLGRVAGDFGPHNIARDGERIRMGDDIFEHGAVGVHARLFAPSGAEKALPFDGERGHFVGQRQGDIEVLIEVGGFANEAGDLRFESVRRRGRERIGGEAGDLPRAARVGIADRGERARIDDIVDEQKAVAVKRFDLRCGKHNDFILIGAPQIAPIFERDCARCVAFVRQRRRALLRRFSADGAGDVGGRIAEREQGANQQIQSDRAVAFFHLREPRLAGADFARQFALRQIALGALLPQAPTASDFDFDESGFFVGQADKIFRVADRVAVRLQAFFLFGVHVGSPVVWS